MLKYHRHTTETSLPPHAVIERHRHYVIRTYSAALMLLLLMPFAAMLFAIFIIERVSSAGCHGFRCFDTLQRFRHIFMSYAAATSFFAAAAAAADAFFAEMR